MVIETRKSRSVGNIGSVGTCNKGVRTPRKLNIQRGSLGRGQISTRVKIEKSDSNLTSAIMTSPGQDKMRLNGDIVRKTNETSHGQHGVIQGFSRMVPLLEVRPTKSNYGIKGGRKSSINNEIRKVTSKNELWPKKALDVTGKSKTLNSLKTPLLNDTKAADGRRTVLRMPAIIPKGGKKLRYNIAVVGTEIKLVDNKTRGSRLTSVRSFTSPPLFRKISTMSRKTPKLLTRAKRKKKTKKVKTSHKESCRNDSIVCSLDQTGDGIAIELNRSELSEVVGMPSDRERMRKVYKFSDRRTKAEVTAKPSQACTGEEILLERLDPISNILSTELVDSIKRCQSIIDFVTAPIENSNPPFIMKQVFYDTTVMEELNFPHLTTAELSGNNVPELKLVPTYLTVKVKKSLSSPDLTSITPKLASRSLCLLGRKRKKKPKIETILATRPKGFQHAKWLEKTVGPDSTLKSKLLQDVIISQVKKCLKRQAELRQKLQTNAEIM